MNHSQDKFEEEIELIDILRIIWKWKFVILVGILISALIGFGTNFKKSPIYRVSTVLQPGVLRVDERGKKVYIDDPENMKALIESGTLNDKIFKNLETIGNKRISVPLRFKIIMPKKSNILRIYYQTRSAELGVQVLNLLPKILLEEYKSEYLK
jgi:uncharacterized protein involved in exopolysaccharide biosynthesis